MPKEFQQDNYIYLITDSGGDAVFRGIKGNLKQWKDAPYLICPVHTKAAWAKYEAEQATEPEETLPEETTPNGDSQDVPATDDSTDTEDE